MRSGWRVLSRCGHADEWLLLVRFQMRTHRVATSSPLSDLDGAAF